MQFEMRGAVSFSEQLVIDRLVTKVVSRIFDSKPNRARVIRVYAYWKTIDRQIFGLKNIMVNADFPATAFLEEPFPDEDRIIKEEIEDAAIGVKKEVVAEIILQRILQTLVASGWRESGAIQPCGIWNEEKDAPGTQLGMIFSVEQR